MKVLIIVLLFPLISYSQSNKALAKIADTISFSNPLEFVFIDTCQLSKHDIYAKCIAFFATHYTNTKLGTTVGDSITGQIIIHDIVSDASNEESKFSLVIDLKENKYRMKFTNYRITRGTMFKNMPFDDEATKMGAVFSGVNKKSYWNIQRMKFMYEAKRVHRDLQIDVAKNDNF